MIGWRNLRQQGINARNIVVGGDSAGGNLTIALINALREANEDLPACAWLVSPWTDLTMSGKTLESKDHIDPIIHRGYLVELADAYAPTSLDRRNPLLSPLFSVLAGFPPTLIQVGSAETLLSDSTRFAEAAAEANVATTLEVWPEMIHAWPLWNAGLTDARLALKSAGQFMKRRLLDRVP
jgi:acetyl esterase/lipase